MREKHFSMSKNMVGRDTRQRILKIVSDIPHKLLLIVVGFVEVIFLLFSSKFIPEALLIYYLDLQTRKHIATTRNENSQR